MTTPAPLQQLHPGAWRQAEELVAGLALGAGARPGVAAPMIATADGRAAIAGRSVALGHPADRALLRSLRAAVDAVLVGTTTLAAERYATLVDEGPRAARLAAGRPPHPIVATISRKLDLPLEVPLFSEPGVPIVVATESDAPAPEVIADLHVLRFAPGTLTVGAVLDALAERRGVGSVSCEGGPQLLRRLVAERRLDHLLLTVAPLLAAGDAPSVLEGAALDHIPELTLAEVHRADQHLFLHYTVGT
jgi:riboflavin biosynthesis pyrimidine reductase